MRHDLLGSAGILALLFAATAASAQTVEQETTTVDEVVVTGTPVGRSRLDAPFAITSYSEAAIERAAPTSIVDLLKTVPGFSAEASGGQGGGQNLYVRGLPSGGWYYVQLQEDGLTLFDEPQESFLNVDILSGLDLMTERVEVVRGGTSPIFANNAPGGTVNFITRRGTPTPEGAARATVGSHGLARGDAYVSGPISDTVLYSLGGFYRRGDGYREPGYTADNGGQVRGSLSFLLGDARIDLDAKYLNDRTAFYNPLPLADPRNPSVSLESVLDPLEGTLLSDSFQITNQRTFYAGDNKVLERDLADGIHTKVFETGAALEWKTDDGLTVTNKFRFTDAQVTYDTVFSGSSPTDAAAYLATQLARARTGFGTSVARVGYTIAADNSVFDPSATGLVLESGLWSIQTDLTTIANDLRVTKVFDEGRLGQHTLSGGLYYNRFDYFQDRLQSTILTNIQNRPDLLNVLAYDASGRVIGSVTENGFVRYGNGVTRGETEGYYLSPYLWDSVKFGNLGIDAGIRYTKLDHEGGVYAGAVRNLGDPTTLADDNVGGLSGVFSPRSDKRDATSWTVGAEYKIDPRVQLFARYTDSERLPRLQNVYQTQNVAVTGIVQAESGLRAALPGLSFSATGFYSRFDELSTSAIVLNSAGAVQTVNLLGGTETRGIEADIDWRPTDWFGLRGAATVQDPKTKDLLNVTTGAVVTEVEGKQISRIPKTILSLTPTVYFNVMARPVEVSATVYHMGERFVDYTNKTALPAYTTVDLAVSAPVTDSIDLRANVSNVFNEVGLTEGNARTDILSGQGTDEAIYARPIFGRLFTVALTYRW